MLPLILLITVLWSTPVVHTQSCDPVDFGEETIVCRCNSTYCDYYPDPKPVHSRKFIWYSTSKGGKRLERVDGHISKHLKFRHRSCTELGNSYTITINSTNQSQTIEGFGGAFTDAAAINIKNLSLNVQDHLMRSYFSRDGSKYNLGRVPIAGTDFSTRAYTYDEVEGDTTLKNFALTEEDTFYKIPLMKKALKLNPELLFLSASWTAPIWMKNNQTYNGYSFLLEKYYQTYADYTVKFLEEYKKHGVQMWAVSTGNEPFTPLNPISHINSMYMSAENASNWVINNLGPTLQKSSSNSTYILMYDDQRSDLLSYVTEVKTNHSEALKYIKGIAIHWYTDPFISPDVLVSTHKLVPGRFILMTEACVGFYPFDDPKVILGSWSRTETMIDLMIENLNNWVAGWVDWNLALNTIGGPNWVENYVDSPIIIDAEKDVFYKQPYYYVMSHFSKFIPRNSVQIQAESNNNTIFTTAFKTPDGQKVVIIHNRNNIKVNISVIDDPIGNINIELPENSLNTILYKH